MLHDNGLVFLITGAKTKPSRLTLVKFNSVWYVSPRMLSFPLHTLQIKKNKQKSNPFLDDMN